jgi:hypothetical protein
MKTMRMGVLAALLIVLPLAAGPQAADTVSGPEMLSDSTLVEHWTLANGLRVTTRHAPWAPAVAITVAYDFGSDDDPPAQDGMAHALAELVFTSATADLPERTRDELDSQRPFGWSFNTTRRMTLLTEVSAPSRFPGVLNQVASRMRGVKPTKEQLAAAVRTSRDVANQQIFGPTYTSLFYLTREVALGRKEAAMERHAAAKELDRLTVAQAQEAIAKKFVPANASLAIAGNLTGLDMRKLVQNLFGSIPAGSRYVRSGTDSLRSGQYIVQFQRSGPSAWAIGILAPALADTVHPSFYLNSLLFNGYFDQIWKGEPDAATAARYMYPLLDEPDMVRILPPADPKNISTDGLSVLVEHAMAGIYREVVTEEDYETLRRRALWIVGGPMDDAMREQGRKEAAPWHTMARSMAARELRGGPAFWTEYRTRFTNVKSGNLGRWGDYFATPANQVRLLVVPGR